MDVMKPNEFVHLHTHSDASRIDGLGTPARLIAAAKRIGFNKLAMTDHGSLANAIVFSSLCNDFEIKPIIGMEGYIEVDGKVGHITLLADGNEGFSSLIKINNAGQRSEHQRPAFNVDTLIEHNAGIILLTGCPASPLQEMEYPDAKSLGLRLKDVFGNRMFAEMMFVSDQPWWERGLRLSQDLRIPLVTTNDVHFPYKTDADIHTILTKMKAGFTYESRNLFLATPAEIIDRITALGKPEMIDFAKRGMYNANMIAELIRPVYFSDKPKLPEIENADKQLIDAAYAGLDKLGLSHNLNYCKRLELELKIITSMDFSTYFLILHDLIQFAKASDIRVGPGRGSGAGSLVLYCLEITEIDPLKYDLSFERFLNPARKGMPDVDVDFDSDGRHEVIKYAIDKWKAFPVATYSRYSHKMLVHDLSKQFKITRELEVAAADAGPESEEFGKIIKGQPMFQQAYDAMLGQIRHIGQHAGGIIIADIEAPLERASGDDTLVVAWTEGDNKELTQTGFVKYDLLGLTALSVLKILETKFGKRADEPVDDDPVFSIFRSGDLAGIFQFTGSSGIIDYTKMIAPRKFDDLVAINALYRPGALDAGTAKFFPQWRKSPRLLHPLVDPILADTAGVIVYQEQVMQVYSTLTNGDLASADIARRTISKSHPGDPGWEEAMAKLREDLVEGAAAKFVDIAIAEKIWEEIATHSRYSFNKSHSVAYARIAWDLAWWKYHYSTEFYAAILTVDSSEAQKYVFDAVQHGISIKPPHVNYSTANWEATAGSVWMPLSVVKFLGSKGVDAIINNRPYKSATDFMNKVAKREVTKRARAGLVALGAFDDVPGTLAELELTEDPVKESEELNQQSYMGFIIPDEELIQKIKYAESTGLVAGIVYDKEEKESMYGKYVVYRLLPTGSYWSREITKIEVGSKVQFKVHSGNGKILKAFSL